MCKGASERRRMQLQKHCRQDQSSEITQCSKIKHMRVVVKGTLLGMTKIEDGASGWSMNSSLRRVRAWPMFS